MRIVRLALVLVALTLTTVARAATPAPPTFDTAAMNRIFDTLERNNRLRGSVAVTRDGQVVYSRALGLRDDHAKMTAATMVRIGSITKVFTAALIYQLIDEKKLTLDTKLSRFFPQIPNADAITIAQLLAHATGIPNFPSGADISNPKSWIFQPQTKASMVERFAAMRPAFAPGEKVAYSNANYVLLGYIVEAVTHSDYDTQLQKRVARKLGLRRTRFGGAVRTANDEAHSFVWDDSRWTQQPEEDASVPAGAGAILSTPSDLAKFITALFTGRLVSARSMQELITPLTPQLDGLERKGVVVSTLHRGLEKTIYSHLGGIDGFRSNLVYFPEDRVAIAITLNGQDYPMGKLFWLLADMTFRRPVTAPSFATLTLPAETLAQYTGVYSMKEIGMDITITRDGDQLRAQATGQDSFRIDAIGDTLFSDPSSGILIEFRRETDGSVPQFSLYQGWSDLTFRRN